MDRGKIKIMGIVNLTEDSYFADSRCLRMDGRVELEKVMDRVGLMVEEGADIIDIGACSTRPGSVAVGEEVEWQRLGSVLGLVRENFPGVEISVDTYWASVVRRTFDCIGPFIVNDISAGEDDPRMLGTVGELGLQYVAMHKRGQPSQMQELCDYKNVTSSVIEYFRDFELRAREAGIEDWILDPGFGFAKTVEQNYQLLRDLDKFSVFGRRILVGVSRKSMIYRRFGIAPEEALPQTQVLHFAALLRGADILRVHDVAEARRTVELFGSLA